MSNSKQRIHEKRSETLEMKKYDKPFVIKQTTISRGLDDLINYMKCACKLTNMKDIIKFCLFLNLSLKS